MVIEGVGEVDNVWNRVPKSRDLHKYYSTWMSDNIIILVIRDPVCLPD